MAVPKHLQAKAGVKLIRCPLKTADIDEARLLAAEKRAKLLALWTAGEGTGKCINPSSLLIDNAADLYGGRRMQAALEEINHQLSRNLKQWTKFRDARISFVSNEQDVISLGALEPFVTVSTDICRAEGWDLPENSSLRIYFLAKLASAAMSCLNVELRRLTGANRLIHRSEIKNTLDKNQVHAVTGQRLTDFFELLWESDPSACSRSGAYYMQSRRIVYSFSDMIGRERRVDKVSRRDVKKFADSIIKLPKRWEKHPDLLGRSITEAAFRAEKLGLKPITLNTAKTYIKCLSILFNRIINDGWLVKNPCSMTRDFFL